MTDRWMNDMHRRRTEKYVALALVIMSGSDVASLFEFHPVVKKIA